MIPLDTYGKILLVNIKIILNKKLNLKINIINILILMVLIPIYVQYYDENKNIITKEVTQQDSPNTPETEIGVPVTVKNNETISIKYFNSNIIYAKTLAEKWAKRKNVNVFFNTFIFTTDAEPEWWAIQPKKSSYYDKTYNIEFISMYKIQGIGIIFRDINLQPIINQGNKKNFYEQKIESFL